MPGPSGQESKFDFSAERVTASVRESLQRLQTDYIDIIQCHDIEFADLSQASDVVRQLLASACGAAALRYP